MNVSTVGIKGYEYQYKSTVLIALSMDFENRSELYVEKAGSEDATLIINKNSGNEPAEIQIKRESSNIDINKLLSWLCHFQEKSSDNNLLYRITNYSCIALFVTQSRCWMKQ